MIEVNLLPVELRPTERTPYPRFFLILLTVMALAVEGFVIIGLHVKISNLNKEIAAVNGEIKQMQVEAKQVDRLKDQYKELNSRVSAVRLTTLSSSIAR